MIKKNFYYFKISENLLILNNKIAKYKCKNFGLTPNISCAKCDRTLVFLTSTGNTMVLKH